MKSPGMPPKHVLARDAIQNSVDAGIDSAKVLVRFRATAITGAAKAAFVAAAGLDGIAVRAGQLELASPNCLHSLEKPRTPLQLLYVEAAAPLPVPELPRSTYSVLTQSSRARRF